MSRFLVAALLAAASWSAHAAQYIGSVEAGQDSVALRFALWDEDTPATCPSTDITNATANLTISVSANNEASATTYTGAKILSIATPGTYSAPTNSDEIRFGVVDAGSCEYEVQLRNERLDVASAERLYIQISDNGAEIMDALYWVDMTAVSVESFLASDCSAFVTENSLGYQLCTVLNAVLTDTGTTLHNKLTDVQNAQSGNARPRARLGTPE